jgi:bifunctional non-homologous end joining protein LigD
VARPNGCNLDARKVQRTRVVVRAKVRWDQTHCVQTGQRCRAFFPQPFATAHPTNCASNREAAYKELILDGEVTWGHGQVTYHVFDLLWIDGRLVTSLPLEERQAHLNELQLKEPLQLVEALVDESPWERAKQEGWEGVIAKRRGSVYEHRRSKQWLKMKCELSQEFVVGGFTDPQGARVGLGALLVGHYEADEFCFAGKIGTGFDTKLLLDLRAKLDQLEIAKSPFTKAVGLPRLRVHWVTPEIRVDVGFIEWTGHGKLRHPRLLGVKN